MDYSKHCCLKLHQLHFHFGCLFCLFFNPAFSCFSLNRPSFQNSPCFSTSAKLFWLCFPVDFVRKVFIIMLLCLYQPVKIQRGLVEYIHKLQAIWICSKAAVGIWQDVWSEIVVEKITFESLCECGSGLYGAKTSNGNLFYAVGPVKEKDLSLKICRRHTEIETVKRDELESSWWEALYFCSDSERPLGPPWVY